MISEILFIPIGMIVGTLSGFYGIGGGIVLVPILLLSGFPPAIAVATSMMFTFGTSLSGAAMHAKMDNVDWKVAAMIGSAGALSAQGSKLIVLHISGRYSWLLNVWLVLILCYFAWDLYHRNKRSDKKPLAIKNKYTASITIGLIVGFLAALLGIGGGFITVPLLIAWLGFAPRRAIGTSLGTIIIISIGGIVGYGAQLDLNYLLGFCLISGAFIGSPLGAKMTVHYQTAEMTHRLWILYLFVISSITIDLAASFTWPLLEWVSLAVLLTFLAYMLYDFYRHRNRSAVKNTLTT